MKATYYLEVISSWCHWAEPTWAELKARYAGRIEFDWKIALMSPGDFPVSPAQTEWFYRRSGTIMRSPYMLNSGWHEASRAGDYSAPNLVVEAAREFSGGVDDTVRLAVAQAAVRDGLKVGDMAISAGVAAKVLGIEAGLLVKKAQSAEVRARVDASTAQFHSYQINQRPAFVLESGIGDKAIFSGVVRLEPLVATVEAMLSDAAGYASVAAHLGKPPSA